MADWLRCSWPAAWANPPASTTAASTRHWSIDVCNGAMDDQEN
jgi:hypothetical protein